MSTLTERRVVLAIAFWLAAFGVWPIADPGHSGWSPMTIADLTLHAVGISYCLSHLITRYRERT